MIFTLCVSENIIISAAAFAHALGAPFMGAGAERLRGLRGRETANRKKNCLHCVLSFPACTVSDSSDPFPQCAHWGLPLRGAALRGIV